MNDRGPSLVGNEGESRIPIYLDCDTGIDDSMALAYLLAAPGVDLIGVGTVSGNTDATQAARNTLALLALAGRLDIPVAIGALNPMGRTYNGGVAEIHGINGIGNITIPDSPREVETIDAVELLIRLSHHHAGRLRVLTVGPLTNIAHAILHDPTLVDRVESVITMGGAAHSPGNVTAVSEANIWNDPEAAQLVLSADWPMCMVPLDVTMENTIGESDRARLLESDRPIARAVGEMLDHYFNFYLPIYGVRSSALHDPLAAAIAAGGITPTVAPAVAVQVDATDGPGRGQTIFDLRGQRRGPVDQDGAHVRVVLATDRPLGPHLIGLIAGSVTAPDLKLGESTCL